METTGNLPLLSHAKVQPIRKGGPAVCEPVKSFTLKMRIMQTLQAPFCWGCCALWVIHSHCGVSAAPGPYGSSSWMSCSGAGGGWEQRTGAHRVCVVQEACQACGSTEKLWTYGLSRGSCVALSSHAKLQKINALDKKVLLWPILFFVHV